MSNQMFENFQLLDLISLTWAVKILCASAIFKSAQRIAGWDI